MDELVRQALSRWPDVPDCTGWLALDARGRWRIGEEKDGPRLPITHAAMIAFIGRNYASAGRSWIFQNGPQRVFVELEYTPFVWRLHPREAGTWELLGHTGAATTPTSLWLDDEGRFLMQARSAVGEPIIGVLHDHDTVVVADLLRDEGGALLDDDVLSRMSGGDDADTVSTIEAALHLTMVDGVTIRLPLQRIAARQVATRFGFEPRPSQALRVDVDTRR